MLRKFLEKRGRNPIWIIIYSDLTTNLMLFFLMLFALTRMSYSERKAITDSMRETFSSEKKLEKEKEIYVIEKKAEDKFKKIITSAGLNDVAYINVNEEYINISLQSPIIFPSGEVRLKKDALPVLDQIAAVLKNLPNRIIVEGHTDNVPVRKNSKFKDNWELSGKRAYSVVRYLIEKHKISPSRLAVAALGDSRPVASNDTPEGRKLNRRIEIKIVRTNL